MLLCVTLESQSEKQATEAEIIRKKDFFEKILNFLAKGNGKNVKVFYILKYEEEMATLSVGSTILLLKSLLKSKQTTTTTTTSNQDEKKLPQLLHPA